MHNSPMTLPRPLPWRGLALFVELGVVGCGSLKDERPAKRSFIQSNFHANFRSPDAPLPAADIELITAWGASDGLNDTQADPKYCDAPVANTP
jgi:hypothetical protein